MSSMVIRVDAESEWPKRDEIKRDFKRIVEENVRDIWSESWFLRPWAKPSHLGANHAEQIIGLQADRSERLSTYNEIERAFKWFGTEENFGKISAIEELNPERLLGELIHSRAYCAKPFIDLQADRSERPSTYDEIERVFKLDEENGEKIFNFSGESIRRLKMKGLSVEWAQAELYPELPWSEPKVIMAFAHSSYYDNNFGNNVEYGRHNMSSRKDGAGPYDDVFIVDIPEAVDDDKRVKLTYNWPAAGLMGAVAEQGVAGVLANRIAATNNSYLGVHFMEIAIVWGLGFKLAGVALKRSKRPNLPIWMGKIGDVLTASAIILSLAMHLPPLMAWTAAPLAFLLIAFAVAFA